tara:strand:+ start:513 stop:1019 length:507 start_codon:yes stop_codon:yes gene_type:complete
MKNLKIFIIILFITFSSLTNIAYAELLKFAASTYEGEVKKGKAHGVGIFTFSDGSTYEGKVSKNRIHGNGKYTDAQGKVYEGKFRYGTIKIKIDKKTRNVVKIKAKTGFETYVEMKGTGAALTKWFEAQQNSSGTYELTVKGKTEMAAAIASGGSDNSSGSSGSSSGC